MLYLMQEDAGLAACWSSLLIAQLNRGNTPQGWSAVLQDTEYTYARMDNMDYWYG